MTKKRRGLAVLIAIALIASIPLLLRAWKWLVIDDCLDSGGAWNYTTKACEH